MSEDYDLVIVGAGLIGASLALRATQQHPSWRIAVLERSTQLAQSVETNQRVVALGQLATHMLEQVGVLAALDTTACFSYPRMFVWDQHSRGELEFNAADVGLPRLGHMIDSVQCNYLLQRALATSPRIEVYFNSQITGLENQSESKNHACVHTNHGPFAATLVVAADGAHSVLRRLAKISASQYRYGQLGLVAKIAPSLSHANTAWQRFLQGGPLGILPLAHNECSIVWSCDEAQAQALCEMSDQQFCDELATAMDHRLGTVKLVSARQTFPLQSQYAHRYFSGRVVLVGDAAHSIHPLAGQGANLGFKDIHCLLEVLAQVDRSNPNLTKILARYERIRQSDNRATDRAMSLLNSAFLRNNPAWAALRGLGMRWVSGSGALKTFLTQQAIGAGH